MSDDKKTRRLQAFRPIVSIPAAYSGSYIRWSANGTDPLDGAYCRADDVARLEDEHAEAIRQADVMRAALQAIYFTDPVNADGHLPRDVARIAGDALAKAEGREVTP